MASAPLCAGGCARRPADAMHACAVAPGDLVRTPPPPCPPAHHPPSWCAVPHTHALRGRGGGLRKDWGVTAGWRGQGARGGGGAGAGR